MTRFRPAACVLALVAAVSVGCPDNIAQLCPAGSKSAGTFLLGLTFQPGAADECRVNKTLDGGPADASLAATSPTPRDSAICVAQGDGGATVFLALADSVRSSPLGDGGSFTFTTSTIVDNSACACSLTVSETITGALVSASDGGITYDPDAGLSPIRGYAGAVVDGVDGGPQCHCNVPCSLRYNMTGTKP
jgi:hypothetical protein